MSMIKLQSVVKKYASAIALNDVSLTIEEGEFFALLGPNGAGKTSIIRLLLDFSRPTNGTVSINDIPCSDPAARAGVGYLPENLRIPSYLSGREFLKRHAALFRMGSSEADRAIDRVIDVVNMKERVCSPTGQYSKGMLQRIGLAAALISSPKLLILDEPVNGLDPIGIREFRLILERLKVDKVTLLLNSHILSEVEKLCSSAAIMNRGQILVKDSIQNLIRDGESLEDVFVRFVTPVN
jgi:ABC-2 type transport system ATP-binding protein